MGIVPNGAYYGNEEKITMPGPEFTPPQEAKKGTKGADISPLQNEAIGVLIGQEPGMRTPTAPEKQLSEAKGPEAPQKKGGDKGHIEESAYVDETRAGFAGQKNENTMFNRIRAKTDPKNLVSLGIVESALSDEGFQANVAAMKNLQGLSITNCPITNKALIVLRDLAKLESIGLYGTKISDAGLQNFKDLKKLSSFSAGRTGITGRGLDNLSADTLTNLDLSYNQINKAGCEKIARFNKLEQLNLTHTPVNDDSLTAFSSLKHLRQLELGETKVGDNGLTAIAKMEALHWLDLSNTTVTSAGIEKLALLKSMIHLELNGTKVKVDDKLIKALSGMQHLNSLELRDVQLSDNDILKLRQPCPTLLSLQIKECLKPSINLRNL